MGRRVHPVSYVKVGVDGMEVDKIAEVLSEKSCGRYTAAKC